MEESKGIKLLYVEDDAGTRILLERLLRQKYPDLTLLIATNGEEGVSLFKEHRPQIVMTDISMPIMGGIEMAAEIRKTNADAIIIAVTAYNDPEYLKGGDHLGIAQYIMKPIQFKDFFGAIDRSISSCRAQRLAGG